MSDKVFCIECKYCRVVRTECIERELCPGRTMTTDWWDDYWCDAPVSSPIHRNSGTSDKCEVRNEYNECSLFKEKK